MFGYVKPLSGELKVKEYDFYKAVYCGLCRALKGNIRCFAEMTLSYDFVFLALLGLAWNNDEIRVVSRRCAVHPLKRRPMLELCPTLDFTASASALLTYYKVKDDIADGKIAAALLLPAVSAMKRHAAIPDELDGTVREALDKLNTLEKSKCASVDAPAQAFGELLAAVFTHAARDERSKRLAYEVGLGAGRWIYIIDALDDLEKDKKHIKRGAYNPFIYAGESSDEASETALIHELERVETAVCLTDFTDGGIENIVKNIIYLGLPAKAREVIYRRTNDNTKNNTLSDDKERDL